MNNWETCASLWSGLALSCMCVFSHLAGKWTHGLGDDRRVWVNVKSYYSPILGRLVKLQTIDLNKSGWSYIQKTLCQQVHIYANCSWVISAKAGLEIWKEAKHENEVIFLQAWRLGHPTAVILMDSLKKCVGVSASSHKSSCSFRYLL